MERGISSRSASARVVVVVVVEASPGPPVV